jgi:O-antigen/teichoic acid export membrane protein
MAGSVSRYLAYAIGRGDSNDVTHWFNTALSLHLCFAFSLVLIGWPIGEYVIANVFKIPPERVPACLWVFRVSLVSAFVSMVSIPFVAMLAAHQNIMEVSAWGILQSVLSFTLAYTFTQVSGDLLLVYAVGMVAITVIIQVAMIGRASTIFRECRIVVKQWFDVRRFKDIFSFAIWNLIGGAGATFRNQGSAILLNLHFGLGVNAAFGIAKQVSAQTDQLSAAMLGAFTPEITASEGRGDRQRMLSLSHRACKYGMILIMLFAVPLIAETDYVLTLWLRTPPPYTEQFCQLILVGFLIDRLTTGYLIAVNARGKIAGYQATVGLSNLLTLPLAWLFLRLGYPPTSVGVAFVITSFIYSLSRVFWMRHLLGERVTRWLMMVVLPCLIVGAATTAAAWAPRWFMPPSFARFACATTLSVVIALLATWLIAFDANEQAFFRQNIRRFLSMVSQAYRRV